MTESIISGVLFFLLGILSILFYRKYYKTDFERQSLFFSICCILLMTGIVMDLFVHLHFQGNIHQVYFPNYVFLLESWSLMYAYFLEVYPKFKEKSSFFIEITFVCLLIVVVTFYFQSLPNFRIEYELPYKTLLKLKQHFLSQLLAFLIGILLYLCSKSKKMSRTLIFLLVHSFFNMMRISIENFYHFYLIKTPVSLEYTLYFMDIIISIYFLYRIYSLKKYNFKK